MKKLFLALFLTLIFFNNSAIAEELLKTQLDKIITNNCLSQTAVISVSIRNIKDEKIIYEKNSQLLLHPASTLKAFTTPVVLKTLGKDYKISTILYKTPKNKNLYLKLSADPLLNTEDLFSIFKDYKEQGFNKIRGAIIIDDNIVDNTNWGKGWMWDDSNEKSMPKFSAYNLNHNLSKETNLPVDDPKSYFIENLQQVIKANKIKFKGKIESGHLPQDAVLITSVNHSLIEEIYQINHKSDNMGAESLFNLAGAEYTKSKGNTQKGFMAFKSFYKELGLNVDGLKLVDASGVSHYNLMNTDWMSLALCRLFKSNLSDIYVNSLAKPGDYGTLENRLTDIKFKLWAKTGSLSGISGLSGYIQSSPDKTYSFSILIQNYNCESSVAKELENLIVKTIGQNQK
jgi:D-alanyl-D-alanine carboxypeptidase/D-alanyl-D-alanine-endopeptidase (penicillin-binding protein 4)